MYALFRPSLCVCMSVCMSVCLSACLYVCLHVCFRLFLFVFLPVSACFHLFMPVSVRLFALENLERRISAFCRNYRNFSFIKKCLSLQKTPLGHVP